MSQSFFKNITEMEEFLYDLSIMLEKWGISDDDWMVGKSISHYYTGIYTHPQDAARDVSVYIEPDKIPWTIDKEARSTVPPLSTPYFNQYTDLQKQHQVGIDLVIPSDITGKRDIQSDKNPVLLINGKKIKVESLENNIAVGLRIVRNLQDANPDEIKRHIYLDKKRYEAIKDSCARVIKAIKTAKKDYLIKDVEEILQTYETIALDYYPEIFIPEKEATSAGELKGNISVTTDKPVKGEVFIIPEDRSDITVPKNKILVFGHFYPIDAPLVVDAKAVITETGGLLNHAAIICRELKVPCIVGVRKATTLLHSDQTIKIDFKTGLIQTV